MSEKLRTVQYRHGFCTLWAPHEQHPYDIIENGRWVSFWCFGEPPADPALIGTPVVLLVDEACWCQNEEQLSARMKIAIGHVIDEVREVTDDLSESDEWQDRWGILQSRSVVPTHQLLTRLDELQHEDTEEEVVDDDDE